MQALDLLDGVVVVAGLLAIIWIGIHFRGGRMPSFEPFNWGTTAFILLWLAAFATALTLVFFAPDLGDLLVRSP